MKDLKRLWPHIIPKRRKQFAAILVLMVFASFAEVVSIGAVLPFLGVLTVPEQLFEHRLAQPLIKFLQLTEPKQLLLPFTILFSIAALASGAMRIVLLWAQTRLSHATGADFSINIYRRTLYQPYSVHVARNSSSVIAGIAGKANAVVGSTILPILMIISSGLMLVTILIALLAIDPFVALSAFGGFGAIYAVVITMTRHRMKSYSQTISREQNMVIKALQEGLGGIRDVLIDGTQTAYCNSYRKADLSLRRARSNVSIISMIPRYGIEALGMILIAVLAYTLAERESGIAGAIPVLGALALGAQRLLPVLQQGYSSFSSMRGGRAELKDALDLLEQSLPAYADKPFPEPIPFNSHIRLKNLSFRYTNDMPLVLQQIDLTITKGSRVGFIGTTGSGKSTLLDLIMALLYSTKGCLMIDDVEITEKNHREWQAHISHVPQAIFLADTTIAENIAFGILTEEVDHERVRKAARQAHMADTIESWEMQYETMVGERGVRLSGGQRQRIGIARALYKQADVIVFDEATSALDNETETAVMRAVDNISKDITVLIVAHRVTTLKSCDNIIELTHGEISRSGTYQGIIGNIDKLDSKREAI
ncbi:ABC transporter ATP-binding protein [Solemya elarraichensis gill symbiont]|uniref:ABC transporter ATP-binding protein n=2 Tax=Solemya elarraichensis gill symbiont TaxID=1918949 RepID=A0A1T2L1F2_9GAMM|nr:ABC transporter ATP-binding protein [Solemya elarraichensis gill symbiont]